MNHAKTNAMRLLDKAGLAYGVLSYPYDPDDLSGTRAAQALDLPAEQVYKTLVAQGDRSGYLVCCIAVHRTADLKKLAEASGNKRVDLVPASQLQALTGYLRGGCSPLAMKKKWPVYLDAAVLEQDHVAVNAGRRGLQIWIRPQDLVRAAEATVTPLCQAGGSMA